MAGQIPTRREVLEALTLAAFAGFAPGFVRWAPAQQQTAEHQHTHGLVTPAATTATPPAAYQPVGLSPAQYATIERLCDLILPHDGRDPGAAAAGVPEFIDFMVAQDASIQQPFVTGLQALDTLSKKAAGGEFSALSESRAKDVLTRLAYPRLGQAGDANARSFFRLVRKYTVMGFYTSEIGFQALDSPNLKFYSESPGCPDPNDPAHQHAPGSPAA